MQVKVLFFASLKEQAGTSETQFSLPDGALVKDLKALLGEQFPNLQRGLPTSLISVNREFAFDEEVVPVGAEVALFPPVSGGAEHPTVIRVTEELLDLNQLLAGITSLSTGAACMFTGMVRGLTTRDEPHETIRLEYEAYTPMAEAKMRQVAEEIRERWPAVEGIAIVQRVGRLDPQTPTVAIACTAGHRDSGVFEAARYGIDRLKEIVPVWKKEVGSRGEVWVEGHYTPTRED